MGAKTLVFDFFKLFLQLYIATFVATLHHARLFVDMLSYYCWSILLWSRNTKREPEDIFVLAHRQPGQEWLISLYGQTPPFPIGTCWPGRGNPLSHRKKRGWDLYWAFLSKGEKAMEKRGSNFFLRGEGSAPDRVLSGFNQQFAYISMLGASCHDILEGDRTSYEVSIRSKVKPLQRQKAWHEKQTANGKKGRRD